MKGGAAAIEDEDEEEVTEGAVEATTEETSAE